MQQHAAEAILCSDGDVVLLSPTGTGKTLAYLLPLIQQLDATSDDVQALVVVPGRELALQSDTVLRDMGSGIRSASCYGGRATMDEHRKLKEVNPQIIFGTPGRLNDHLDKENINRYHIRWLVIDEFDKCLAMGFHQEMQKLIKSLPALQRRILLSATNAEQIPQFVNMAKKGTLVDFLPEEEQTSERVTLYEVKSPQKDKLETLRNLLLGFGDESSIVFLNYRDSVERVNNYLTEQGFVTSFFHGGLEQKQREAALYRFSNGSANVLVATDLASRGLDIPDIQNIIHYHMPESEEGYIHRVGRTARWDKQGRAFFITGPEEHIPEYVEGNIEEYSLPSLPREGQGVSLPRMATLYIGKGKKDKVSKGDIVGFLCKKGGLQADEIGRIDVNDRYTYVAVKREKLQQVIRQTQGEKIKGIKTIIEPVR
ncbi:MAG: DEAD/DEAH box helicase [Prevotella sp.]|nr:DEAD/DEAH box helicase [Prevotella sp.]